MPARRGALNFVYFSLQLRGRLDYFFRALRASGARAVAVCGLCVWRALCQNVCGRAERARVLGVAINGSAGV